MELDFCMPLTTPSNFQKERTNIKGLTPLMQQIAINDRYKLD